MNIDIINGRAYKIYSPSEIEEAKASAINDAQYTRIATKCCICREHIESSVELFLSEDLISHTDAYHDFFERMKS